MDGGIDLLPADSLALIDPTSVQPQFFTQLRGSPSIDLSSAIGLRLHHNDSVTMNFLWHFNYPVTKTIDFNDGSVAAAMLKAASDQVLEKRSHFLVSGADLLSQNNVSILISKVDRQLSGMLVDSKVKNQHWVFQLGAQLEQATTC